METDIIGLRRCAVKWGIMLLNMKENSCCNTQNKVEIRIIWARYINKAIQTE